MAKVRKRPRGAEPRTVKRSLYLTPTLYRAVDRHAKRLGLSFGALAHQMLTDQAEALGQLTPAQQHERKLAEWFAAIPEEIRGLVWDLGQAAASKRTTGGKKK